MNYRCSPSSVLSLSHASLSQALLPPTRYGSIHCSQFQCRTGEPRGRGGSGGKWGIGAGDRRKKRRRGGSIQYPFKDYLLLLLLLQDT